MSKQCVTHHFACDCREEKFKELERENSALRVRLESLAINSKKQTEELKRENAELGKDKARLDWFLKLEEDDRVKFCRGWYRWTPKQVKAEIDAELRKETQP